MPRKKTVLREAPFFKPTPTRITIQKARKILGNFGRDLSDEKIEALLDYLYAIAEIEYENIMQQMEKRKQSSDQHVPTSEYPSI